MPVVKGMIRSSDCRVPGPEQDPWMYYSWAITGLFRIADLLSACADGTSAVLHDDKIGYGNPGFNA